MMERTFAATAAEIYFGLGRYEDAGNWLEQVAAAEGRQAEQRRVDATGQHEELGQRAVPLGQALARSAPHPAPRVPAPRRLRLQAPQRRDPEEQQAKEEHEVKQRNDDVIRTLPGEPGLSGVPDFSGSGYEPAGPAFDDLDVVKASAA